MSNVIDVTNRRFERLVAIKRIPRLNGRPGTVWLCQCDCGNFARASYTSLIRQNTRSCGCLLRDIAKARVLTHGMTESTEYFIWSGMRQRCNNENAPAFKNYGGRGIRICERWNKFEHFLDDMGRRPSEKHSIDRIDNDGPYTPDNCHWVLSSKQVRNRRLSKKLYAFGKTKLLIEWAEEYNIPYKKLWKRLHDGIEPEEALTIKLLPRGALSHKAIKSK